MANLMVGLGGWFAGKKTILGGSLIMVAAVAAVWFGKVDAVTGLGIFGAGLSVVGGGAKANRHQAEMLAALQGVAKAGADYRAGKSDQAIQDFKATAQTLLPVVAGDLASVAGPSLHISGSTAAELVDIVKGLHTQTVLTTASSPSGSVMSQITSAAERAIPLSGVVK